LEVGGDAFFIDLLFYHIRVSEYQLVNKLPKEFKSTLPSIKEIEAELQNIEERRC